MMLGPEQLDAETVKRLLAAGMIWSETRQDWILDPAVWEADEETSDGVR